MLCCWIIYLLFLSITESVNILPILKAREVEDALQHSCLLLTDVTSSDQTQNLLSNVSNVFIRDDGVAFGLVDLSDFTWTSGLKLKYNLKTKYKSHVYEDGYDPLVLLKRNVVDRSCLHAVPPWNPAAEYYRGAMSLPLLVDYVNNMCQTYRNTQGQLTNAGHHRLLILNNLFHVSDVSNTTIQELYSNHDNISKGRASNEICLEDAAIKYTTTKYKYHENTNSADNSQSEMPTTNIPECERVAQMSEEEFMNSYLMRSKPFILENVAKAWPAYKKWSMQYLRDQFSTERVHIKLTPGGDYEGVEPAYLWEDFNTFQIPPSVQQQLQFPDLVVVRPAGHNMKFEEFLDLVDEINQQEHRNKSAYLEYSSLQDAMPGAEKDVIEPEFANRLKLEHLNIWLSDGNTLGRLHFDPFDNVLVQLRGQKQVTLFDPHENERLYEAHIPQATLQYSRQRGRFRRRGLEESTSMVMAPVDLNKPDFKRFPRFSEAYPLNCTLREGDMLYMPAFWWHEVKSTPNTHERRNLAVNFWYEPFLRKEFPCTECRLDVNPFYNHLLE